MPLAGPHTSADAQAAERDSATDALAVGRSPGPLAIPLGTLTLLFIFGSAALAAVLGFGLALWVEPAAPWMVGLASAVGVLFTAMPVGAALLGLASRHAAAPSQPPQPPQPATVHRDGAAPRIKAPAGEPGLAARSFGHALPLALDRELFMDMVGREWSRARRYGTGAALLLVEVDRYARLTDALGDTAGEKVLSEMLAATSPTLRGADALARYEPGRLAVFLAHADATGALDVAERIRERAEQMEVAVPPRRVRFTVSVGVAHLRPAHLHLQALVDDVVDALAAARTVGGNCVRAAPVDMPPRAAPGPARDGSRADKG